MTTRKIWILAGITAATGVAYLYSTRTLKIGYFVCPYKISQQDDSRKRIVRYCSMDDDTPRIKDSGGRWSESEILGDRCVVKVKAPESILSSISQCRRLPGDDLKKHLSSFSSEEIETLRKETLDAGYSKEEYESIASKPDEAKLGDVLELLTSRRMTPSFDPLQNKIIFKNPAHKAKSVYELDSEVKL